MYWCPRKACKRLYILTITKKWHARELSKGASVKKGKNTKRVCIRCLIKEGKAEGK